MSDSQIIRNSTPHEISLPAGSRNAVGKSAQPGGPTIKRVLVEDDVYVAEPPFVADDGVFVTAPPSTAADDVYVTEPPPGAGDLANLGTFATKSATATLVAKESANPATTAAVKPDVTPSAPTPVPSIAAAKSAKKPISDNLAARLAALDTENEFVSGQLDELEALMAQKP